jgi:hypothetical protein
MDVTDAVSFTGTSTSSPFNLKGGAYEFSMVLSGTASVAIYALGPDNQTYIAVPNSTLSATGFTGPLWLAPGQYEFHISGTPTACYASIAGVSY